ncbi:MAG: hypothetical protein JWQ23_2199, partial [Herminiimonas sp.]|nr:hypothetical protein [Herminiimonas sp.]
MSNTVHQHLRPHVPGTSSAPPIPHVPEATIGQSETSGPAAAIVIGAPAPRPALIPELSGPADLTASEPQVTSRIIHNGEARDPEGVSNAAMSAEPATDRYRAVAYETLEQLGFIGIKLLHSAREFSTLSFWLHGAAMAFIAETDDEKLEKVDFDRLKSTVHFLIMDSCFDAARTLSEQHQKIQSIGDIKSRIRTADVEGVDEDRLVFEASATNSAEKLDILLKLGLVPSRRALCATLSGGHFSMARQLVCHGAEVDAPLVVNAAFAAADGGDPDLARLLLKAGRLIDAAALCAAGSGHTAMMKLCLELGVDVNPRLPRFIPLRFAAADEHSEIVRLLLAAGADDWGAIIRRGASENIMQILRAHRDRIAAPNLATDDWWLVSGIAQTLASDDPALARFFAGKNEEKEAVLKRFESERKNNTSLKAAVARKIALGQAGLDTTMVFKEAQLQALTADAQSIIKRFQEQIDSLKGRIDSWQVNGLSLLTQAATTGNLAAVQRLHAMGANLRQHDCHGNPPVVAAARAGKWAVVLWLLRQGASVNQSNGNTGDNVQTYIDDPTLSGSDRDEISAGFIDSTEPSYLNDSSLSPMQKFEIFSSMIEAGENMTATRASPVPGKH